MKCLEYVEKDFFVYFTLKTVITRIKSRNQIKKLMKLSETFKGTLLNFKYKRGNENVCHS